MHRTGLFLVAGLLSALVFTGCGLNNARTHTTSLYVTHSSDQHSPTRLSSPPKTSSRSPSSIQVQPNGGIGLLHVSYTPTHPHVGQQVTITGRAWTPSHQPASHMYLAIEGLTGPSSSVQITTNTQGYFHLTHVWTQTGTYRVNLGEGPIGEVLNITVKKS